MYNLRDYFWGIPTLCYPASKRVFLEIETEVFLPCWYILVYLTGLPCGFNGKESACNAGDPGSIPFSLEEGNGSPLQYSCLENHMGRGVWWAMVHGVAKSRTSVRDKRCHLATWTLMSLFPCHHRSQGNHSQGVGCLLNTTGPVTSGFLEPSSLSTGQCWLGPLLSNPHSHACD